MTNVCVVLGASGTVGSFVAESLTKEGKTVIKVSASNLTTLNSGEFSVAIDELIKKIITVKPDGDKCLGLVLAHRYRGDDILKALNC